MAVTCRDIMGLKTCERLKLIGGPDGLDNIVTWPYIKNMETIGEWIHGGELVFVIGAREDISEHGLLALMEEADKYKIAGVVMLVGEGYITKVPRSVIRFANEHAVALFKIPFRLKLIDITREISHYILEDRIRSREQAGQAEENVIEMLLSGRNREDILSYCFRKIQPLEEADRVVKTEYVRTLKCFLECQGDILHAAQKLYIHRNTMINRMKKINVLLNTNLHDPAVSNEYWNVFSILEYCGTVISGQESVN